VSKPTKKQNSKQQKPITTERKEGGDDLKGKLVVLLLSWRAGVHWNRMIAKLDKTGQPHRMLVTMDSGYRRSSDIYHDTINRLVESGHYRTAKSLIKAKRR
jgi:hypothetical protein